MHHPHGRAARRHAREVWRNHRRKIIYTRYLGNIISKTKPVEHSGWMMCGKQYTACGNRCGHCIMDRLEKRRELKTLRRKVPVAAFLTEEIEA